MTDKPSAEQLKHFLEPASRSDVVSAIIAVESRITSLASAVIALKDGDQPGFFSSMQEYFDGHNKVMNSINELMMREATDE